MAVPAPDAPEEIPAAAESDSAPYPETESVSADVLLAGQEQPAGDSARQILKSILEAVVYVLNEPKTAAEIAVALERPVQEVEPVLAELASDTQRPDRGILIREVAGGYQMATKPEHHEIVRTFVKNLKQPLKLSQAALETIAVIAYKQPITAPEIMEIRGVQGVSVLKTLLDRKVITTAGRKNVIGKPILYKTTKEFLTQFGLKDLAELPTLKEFEEIRRQSMADEEIEQPAQGELSAGTSEASEAAAETGDAAAPAPGTAAETPVAAGAASAETAETSDAAAPAAGTAAESSGAVEAASAETAARGEALAPAPEAAAEGPEEPRPENA